MKSPTRHDHDDSNRLGVERRRSRESRFRRHEGSGNLDTKLGLWWSQVQHTWIPTPRTEPRRRRSMIRLVAQTSGRELSGGEPERRTPQGLATRGAKLRSHERDTNWHGVRLARLVVFSTFIHLQVGHPLSPHCRPQACGQAAVTDNAAWPLPAIHQRTAGLVS